MTSRTEALARYRGYLAACNRRDWPTVRRHLAPEVEVNGHLRSPADVVADLVTLVEAFPDFSWALQHAVWEEPWLAVHLEDAGTRRGPFHGAPADGTPVTTTEMAMLRFRDGCLAEVRVTADNERLTRTASGG